MTFRDIMDCCLFQNARMAAGRTRRRSAGRENPLQPVCALGGQGRVDRYFPCSGVGGRSPGSGSDRLIGGQGPSLRQRRKRGERTQAIGRSRGGRTTKIHALTDGACRPIAFLLTGGQVADCTTGSLLLEQMPPSPILSWRQGV